MYKDEELKGEAMNEKDSDAVKFCASAFPFFLKCSFS